MTVGDQHVETVECRAERVSHTKDNITETHHVFTIGATLCMLEDDFRPVHANVRDAMNRSSSVMHHTLRKICLSLE